MNARQSQAVRYSAWRDVGACLWAIVLGGLTVGALYAGLLAIVLVAAGWRP